jgi:hypothetical protein
MPVINRSQITFGLTQTTAPKVGNFVIYDGSDLLWYINSKWVKIAANPTVNGVQIGENTYTDINDAVEAIGAVVNDLVASSGVTSVNGKTGAVTLTATDIGITTISGVTASNIQEALEAINTKASTAYHAKGDATWEQIQALPYPAEGDVYNITTEFTLNGSTYPAGTNVVYTSGGWDVLSGFIDLSGYQPKNVADATATALGLTTDKSVDAALVALNTNKANLSGATFTGDITAPTVTATTLKFSGDSTDSVTGVDTSTDVAASNYTPADANLVTAKALQTITGKYILIDSVASVTGLKIKDPNNTSAFLDISISSDYVSISDASFTGSGVTGTGKLVTNDTLSSYVKENDSPTFGGVTIASLLNMDGASITGIDVSQDLASSYTPSDSNLITAKGVYDLIQSEISGIDASDYVKKSDTGTQTIQGSITVAGTVKTSTFTFDGVNSVTGIDTANAASVSDYTPSDSKLITAAGAKKLVDNLQSEVASGYVTLDTPQTISGAKTFSAEIVANTGINTTSGVANIAGKVERVVKVTNSSTVNLTTGITKAHVTWSSANVLIEYDIIGTNIYQEIVTATDAYAGGLTNAANGTLAFTGTGTAYITELS